MPAPLPIRDDRSPQQLRAAARRERDRRVGARPHALAHAAAAVPTIGAPAPIIPVGGPADAEVPRLPPGVTPC